jgi:hypothetical protein
MFFAVGCNDQGIPTEASNPALDAPTPRPAIVFNDWFPGSVELWDGTGTGSISSNCGEFILAESVLSPFDKQPHTISLEP